MAPAPTRSKNARYQLTPHNITYLSTLQGRYHIAKKSKTTADVIKAARRTIAKDLKEKDGVVLTKVEKQKIENAIELYFRRSCGRRGRVEKSGTRNKSAREIFAILNAANIDQKRAELEANGRAGDARIGLRQRAITQLWEALTPEEQAMWHRKAVEWNNVAPPIHVRIRNAENTLAKRFWSFAQDLYRQSTVRFWGYALYKNSKGQLVTQVVDFNNRLDGAPLVREALGSALHTSGIRDLMEGYGRLLFTSPNPSASPLSNATTPSASPSVADVINIETSKRAGSRVTLKTNAYGEPILLDPRCPPPGADAAKWRIKLFRTFLSESYGIASGQKGPTPTLPWTVFIESPRKFVPSDIYIPDRYATRLKEPYRMGRADLFNLLSYWFQRQEDGDDPVLEFEYYLNSSSPPTFSPRHARTLLSALANPGDEQSGEAASRREEEGVDDGSRTDGSQEQEVVAEDDGGTFNEGESWDGVVAEEKEGVEDGQCGGVDDGRAFDEGDSWDGIGDSDGDSWTGCGLGDGSFEAMEERNLADNTDNSDTEIKGPTTTASATIKAKSSSPVLPPAPPTRTHPDPQQSRKLAVPDWKASPLKARPQPEPSPPCSSEEEETEEPTITAAQSQSDPSHPEQTKASESDEPYFHGPKSARKKKAAKKTQVAQDPVDPPKKKRNQPSTPIPLKTRRMKEQEKRQTRSMAAISPDTASTSTSTTSRPKPRPRKVGGAAGGGDGDFDLSRRRQGGSKI